MSSAIRRRLIPSSVRARLTFWYLLTLGATLAAFAVFVLVIRARSLSSEFDTALELRVHQVIRDLEPRLLAADVGFSLSNDPLAAELPILVRQAGGAMLFRSPAFPSLSPFGERQVGDAARARTGFLSLLDRGEQPFRIATVVERRPGAEALIVQMAASLVLTQRTVNQLGVTLFLFLGIVLVVAWYGSNYTARRALAPVDAIVERVQHIQASRLSDRLDVHADSAEIDRLVLMLNEMLDRIEASMRAARRFAGDVSHELQTPIAAMRGAVELCLSRGRDTGDYQRMATDLLDEIERLTALVKDLRLLALAEAGHLFEQPEQVDVAELTMECSEIARALGEERQIQVKTVIDERPTVAGNASHLRRVVLNLVQNAIRYSPSASTILMSVGQVDGHAAISVKDQGCGISPEDLLHIFEPFYRADPARARETGGTGLGLPIADQVIKAHNGRIDVVSTPGSGSTFIIYLPTSVVLNTRSHRQRPG